MFSVWVPAEGESVHAFCSESAALEEEAEARLLCRSLPPRVAEGVALLVTACDETRVLSGVCCRRFTRASQVSPQQTATLEPSRSPTTAGCTT